MRFRDCTVKSLYNQPGNLITGTTSDPLIGCQVGNSPDRPSGKMVDLDTDWQNASNIYGLAVSLVGSDGSLIMTADYESNPFRDLWSTRAGAAPTDGNASAMFQSVLTHIVWHRDDLQSRFLDELRAASEDDYLSIRLTTYGFNGNVKNMDGTLNPNFGYGKLIGNIGPARSNQPHSFILGRRFIPTTLNKYGDRTSSGGIGCFSSFVDENAGFLHVDLSNALPIDANSNYNISDQGKLEYAVLHNESIKQDAQISDSDYTKLGNVDQSQALQDNQGGIQSLKLTPDQLKLVKGKPLAIIKVLAPQTGNAAVCIREAPLGLEIRPETFAFKLDPNDSAGNSQEVILYAARYGERYAGQELKFSVGSKMADTDNTPSDTPPGSTPRAPIPIYNMPDDCVHIAPARLRTNEYGQARITISGPEIMGNPRGYIDGQLYVISYNFAGRHSATQQPLDKIAVVIYSSFPAPEQRIDLEDPSWDDVKPILQQYANLYPVMSKGLFDFSNREVADSAAFIMHFVFNKSNDDPDQMPVTRDLSFTKRRMLVNYFRNVMQRTGKTLDSQIMLGKRCPLHHFVNLEEAPSLTDVALTHGRKR